MRKKDATEIEEMVEAAKRRMWALSVDGHAPSGREYQTDRGDAPSMQTLLRRGFSYTELVRQAGLLPAKQKRPAARVGANVPDEVEAEIQAAFARGDHVPVTRQDWPFFAIPTGKEVREYPQGDGTVYRVTRYYASIR